jgi:outer membrane lipoprotein LolB
MLRLLLLLMLSACASSTPPVLLRTAQSDVSSFAFNGRVSIRHHGERTSAGVRWTHHGPEDEILLLTPLGQTVARIVSNSNGVMLEESGKTYFDKNADALTEQVLGWHLPLSGLRYWVLALPAAGSEAVIEKSDTGQVKVLRQDGWEINYLRYAAESSDGLPLRMTLQREDMEMQLLIDVWEI